MKAVDQGGVAGSKDGGKLHSEATEVFTASGGLQLLYETAPVGLAFLSTDCRYLMINQHLTEICGISVADHIGRSVRETVRRESAASRTRPNPGESSCVAVCLFA
jgi:PAS domain-containing protein